MFDPAILVGARVTRIDLPSVDSVVFGVHHEGRGRWVQVQVGGGVTVGEIAERVRGQNATPFVTQLRRWLVGAHVAWCTGGGVFRLGFGEYEVVVEAPMQILVLREEKIVGVLHGTKLKARGLRPGGPYTPAAPGSVETAADNSEHEPTGSPPTPQNAISNDPLLAALKRARKKIVTRIAAIESDLQRGVTANDTRDELLERVNTRYQERPGVRSQTSPEARELSEKIYHTAKRMTRGKPAMNARLVAAEKAKDDIERWTTVLESVHDEATRKRIATSLDDLRILPTRIAVPKGATIATATKAPVRLPYRVFTWQGNTAWVGKSGADNEATLRASSPHDLWLHVEGVPGSHVLLRMGRATQMSESGLLGAALLAAHFSKSRDEQRVLVMYCARHQVRFAKGRKQLGQVIPANPKRIWVDTDHTLLKTLLS